MKKLMTLLLATLTLSLLQASSALANECLGKPKGTPCSIGVCQANQCMALAAPEDLFDIQADQLALHQGKPKCNGACVIKLLEESTCNGRPYSSYSSVNCKSVYE
jgi:hypothetical protein